MGKRRGREQIVRILCDADRKLTKGQQLVYWCSLQLPPSAELGQAACFGSLTTVEISGQDGAGVSIKFPEMRMTALSRIVF